MDVLFEYAASYGEPHPGTSWHHVLALAKRTGRLEMRERLIHADGTVLGKPTSEATDMLMRQKLERIAWPGGR